MLFWRLAIAIQDSKLRIISEFKEFSEFCDDATKYFSIFPNFLKFPKLLNNFEF